MNAVKNINLLTETETDAGQLAIAAAFHNADIAPQALHVMRRGQLEQVAAVWRQYTDGAGARYGIVTAHNLEYLNAKQEQERGLIVKPII